MRTKLRPCHRNRFFATCWVMVDTPLASLMSSTSSIRSRISFQSTPPWLQKRPSSDAITVTGSDGAMRSIGTNVRSTRAPVAQRQSIRVETGLTKRLSGTSR